MQIQAAFAHLSLIDLGLLGLRIYSLVPDFKNLCPLCRGADCVVRHGLYHRCVVDTDGSVIERFPIPRFRCRGRGTLRPEAATFSVLPAALVPRRRFSLPLMLMLLDLVGQRRSIPQVLDHLVGLDRGSSGALILEEAAIFRLLSLFARAYLGLDRVMIQLIGVRGNPSGTRGQALALTRALCEKGPPTSSFFVPVLRFHQKYFPALLLDVHTR